MAKTWYLVAAALFPLGCLHGPHSENPVRYRPDSINGCENPVMILPGQASAQAESVVWENVLSTISDDFEIAYSNRHEGRIITVPKNAPGYEQPWKPGSPNARERLLATMQTMRYRCEAHIKAAPDSGYLIGVVVFRELKDQPRPARAMAVPVFQDASTVDRSYEVVDPAIPVEGVWIPMGRDHAYEDKLLGKIRRCQFDK